MYVYIYIHIYSLTCPEPQAPSLNLCTLSTHGAKRPKRGSTRYRVASCKGEIKSHVKSVAIMEERDLKAMPFVPSSFPDSRRPLLSLWEDEFYEFSGNQRCIGNRRRLETYKPRILSSKDRGNSSTPLVTPYIARRSSRLRSRLHGKRTLNPKPDP